MLKKNTMIICGALLLAACGTNQQEADQASDTSIVGGEKVSSSDPITKSTVALVTPKGKSFCTGSLVAPKIVLTASHCLVDYKESKLIIAFGTVAKNGHFVQENLREAAKFFTHEDYDTDAMDAEAPSTPPNDIAVVHLKTAAPAGFAPIEMLKSGDNISEGEVLTLAGFGLTHYFWGSSGVLRKVNTRLKTLLPKAKEFEFGETANRSACMGDSGGPAFLKRNNKLVLVGVTSRGSSRCDSTGIYTDVRYFGGWINRNAAR